MNKKSPKTTILLIGLFLLLASIACQGLFPKEIAPGSGEEAVAKGNIVFKGKGNLSYGECQDPTADVTVNVGVPAKEYEGQEFYDFINPVSVNAITAGAIPGSGDCEKYNLDEKHDWPAKGLYYPKEEKILFFSCSLTDGKAEGEAHLTSEGADSYFEGGYACLGEDGNVVYEVAFSAFQVAK